MLYLHVPSITGFSNSIEKRSVLPNTMSPTELLLVNIVREKMATNEAISETAYQTLEPGDGTVTIP